MAMTMPSNAPVVPAMQEQRPLYPNRNLYPGSNGPVSTIPGYYIQDDSEIIPKYIPMDGSISFFPYKDLSKIVIKQWDANGLNTLVYVIAPPSPMNAQNSPDTSAQPVAEKTPTDHILDTLQNINNGFATTFQQVNSSLHAMQQEMERMAGALNTIIGSDIGGRG